MRDKPPRYNLPPEKFPVLIEGRVTRTGRLVWTERVERPVDFKAVYIPPLAKLIGEPVSIRITYGNGEVEESAQ